MKLFISPHNDDETLFGAFTLMREKPLVVIVTDSWVQFNRGEEITADMRWEETRNAMKILGCPVIRLGIRDDIIDEWMVTERLKAFVGFDTVYIPALQGGHPHHDLVNSVALPLFNVTGTQLQFYATYSKEELHTMGPFEIKPTVQELVLKEQALQCYQSQINLPATKPHFDAVFGKSEWFMNLV